MVTRRSALAAIGSSTMTALLGCAGGVPGASDARNEINRSGLRVAARSTVDRLHSSQPETTDLIESAEALLVFPEILKGSFFLGASNGDGVWFANNEVESYYRATAVSYGFQAGIKTFGYVMAFMDQASVAYVKDAGGWEVGVGPAITVADDGFARRLSTTTLNEGVVVFFVDHVGFFAGSGIEGTKITQL